MTMMCRMTCRSTCNCCPSSIFYANPDVQDKVLSLFLFGAPALLNLRCFYGSLLRCFQLSPIPNTSFLLFEGRYARWFCCDGCELRVAPTRDHAFVVTRHTKSSNTNYITFFLLTALKMPRSLAVVVILLSGAARGFLVPTQNPSHSLELHAKGFGAKETPAPKKKIQAEPVMAQSSAPPPPADTTIDPFPKREESDMSQGKAALEKMRRTRAEQRNQELLKVKEVQEVDAMLRENPEGAVIPEKVAQRMGKRMLPFVGIPLFGAMGSFVGFWYMATYRDQEFQPALVATVSVALLVVGLLGITFSIMSASWDPDREGSFAGLDEFNTNLGNIKTGLSRSRENAILREKMDEFSPAELASLDRKEASKEKRQQSFGDKVGDELD